MDYIVNLIKGNYEWLFSGILTALIPAIISFFVGHKVGYNKAIKQTQNLGDNSSGIQVGGDYIIGGGKNE